MQGLTVSGGATLDGTLNLALVNGFSPAIGNSFQVMTFGSRTGQFATINGTALGNGKQFSPAYSAANLTLNFTAPSTAAQGTRDTDPHELASKPEISSVRSGTDGVLIKFATVPGRIYRLECSEDLTANQWSILFDHIDGTGDPRTLIDSLGTTRPKCFYLIVITAQ